MNKKLTIRQVAAIAASRHEKSIPQIQFDSWSGEELCASCLDNEEDRGEKARMAIMSEGKMTLREIGETFRVSGERVRTLEAIALQSLRSKLQKSLTSAERSAGFTVDDVW